MSTAAQSTPGVQLLGVNLSGAEYGDPVTGVENYDYVYPTTAEIDYFASLGLNTIRIPVAWQRLQPTEDGALDTSQISQLQTLVAYAATKGVTVDLDLHNYGAAYGADVGTAQLPDAAFANFWSQMATAFEKSPNVIFGLMNEPNVQTPAAWAVAAQDAVNAIRATGASQEILVSGSDWDTASSWISSGNAATVGEITDPDNNIVFEVHQYFDTGSSGTSTQVVSPDIGPESLAAITQWAEQNGKKLFLGEFGNGDDSLSLTAESNTLNYLNANANVWQGATYWAGGPWMGSYMFSADPQSNGAEAPQTGVLAAAASTAQTITIFSGESSATITGATSAAPFSGVIITGADAALNTTATVTLSSLLNGTLSDPNAATDDSHIVNGIWTMSGSSAAVAAALDGLAFKPAASLVASGAAFTTTVTATIADAGETTSTASKITVAGSTITVQSVAPMTVTPATEAVATTDIAVAKPFAGVAIADGNAGQTETATVTLSSVGNGTLSDPNATTDGSTILAGVLTVSGSAKAVAAALDGLVFTPTANEVAPGAAAITTVTAAIKDSVGVTASATSTITATDVAAAITIAPVTATVATTDAASAKPFTGVVIRDANAGQTETAKVTLSSAVNGNLTDPNAATDGSTISNGVLTVSGTATAVATALDGLVFTPTANEVAPGAAVTTTVTAAIKDTAGATASATSTITATDVGTAVTITPATAAVTTTDVASAKPFTGVAIKDANAGQVETAKVSLSTAANGTLSDPKAATDGSTISNGVLIVSGSPTAVATALDGLVFTPTVNQVAPGGTVTTTVTAALKDTAGATASTSSTIKATDVAAAITVTPATAAVSTTDAASAKPFTGVAIKDVNAGQRETAKVSLSTAANGTLSDPNAATDGSTISNGVLTVSGSATAVATALDGLVFKPAAHEVAPKASVATVVTAAITDTAGAKASATSTITATAVAGAISVTTATAAVSTTALASAKPFTGVTIKDLNAGQTETATVKVSATANGTLSDPNAATDGSTISNGVLTVSGSATAVATALDGLVFKPTTNQVVAGATVSTTVTASIRDTAGETASASSTVTAAQVAAAAVAPAMPTVDTLALQISQDAWQGDAEFTVSVDGKQVGGDYTASALHSSGDAGTFLLTGSWSSGVNDVQVSFINDAYGGSASEDRNLYVNSIAYNGVTYAGTSAVMMGESSDTFAVGGATPTSAAPSDTITLNLAEDAWEGNAQFVLYIDGKAVTAPQSVTALHDKGATQAFTFTGTLGTGTHTVGVAFVNDAYGGSATEDRNLYVNGVTVNGSSVFSGVKAEDSNGTSSFTFTTPH